MGLLGDFELIYPLTNMKGDILGKWGPKNLELNTEFQD